MAKLSGASNGLVYAEYREDNPMVTNILVAYIVMACIVMAHTVMTCIVMAHTVMAYVVVAYNGLVYTEYRDGHAMVRTHARTHARTLARMHAHTDGMHWIYCIAVCTVWPPHMHVGGGVVKPRSTPTQCVIAWPRFWLGKCDGGCPRRPPPSPREKR